MLTMGSLFAGIGGFELAATWAGMQPVWSNEIEDFPCKVLRKNFNHRIIQDDIKNIGNGRKHELEPVGIICGGFPCQPFSNAGKRKGENDSRHLWPEMLRIIREVKPFAVIGENVPGILSMEDGETFEKICLSLEGEGYKVQAFNIPACGIEAWHRRERIWILAIDTNRYQCGKKVTRGKREKEEVPGKNRTKNSATWLFSRANAELVTNNRRERIQGFQPEKIQGFQPEKIQGFQPEKIQGFQPISWGKNVRGFEDLFRRPDLPQPLVCRNGNGVSGGLDKNMSKRLKGLGNAIVPQVAYELFGFVKTMHDLGMD